MKAMGSNLIQLWKTKCLGEGGSRPGRRRAWRLGRGRERTARGGGGGAAEGEGDCVWASGDCVCVWTRAGSTFPRALEQTGSRGPLG
jgi:hypothetical protein